MSKRGKSATILDVIQNGMRRAFYTEYNYFIIQSDREGFVLDFVRGEFFNSAGRIIQLTDLEQYLTRLTGARIGPFGAPIACFRINFLLVLFGYNEPVLAVHIYTCVIINIYL